MDTQTFDALRAIVYNKSGIAINGNKGALVAARIGKRIRELSLSNAHSYLNFLLADGNEGEIVNLLDVISTNVTSFFREESHFDFLAAEMGSWLAQGQRRFRFWSAACSSGEEPYTLAMVALDIIQGISADIKILATDISTRILEKSSAGVYSEDKVAAIPQNYRNRFFKKSMESGVPAYEVAGELKNIIVFQRINLSKPPFPMRGSMDAIFCRNVMIYFDNTVRKNLLQDLYRLLKPGGYLFVGHAESLTRLLSGFKAV
ncbi:MAG TPA: CheR family methyltransferase, partial [Chitinivibrionales bacterium]